MKQFITILLISTFLYSCDLDIPLEDSISGEDAIDNVDVAREAINNAYFSYPKYELEFSILSDDFMPTYLINHADDLKKLYSWYAQSIKDLSKNIWKDYYKNILNINIVLNSESYIKFKNPNEKEVWETIKAEAYTLKALLYSDLLFLYTDEYSTFKDNLGIILKDDIKLQFLKRNSVDDCCKEIDRLLTYAKPILKGNFTSKAYMTYSAALLIEARMCMYKKEYSKAINSCNKILLNVGDNLVDTKEVYKKVWEDGDNIEKIFAQDNYTFIPNLITYEKKIGDLFIINKSIDYTDEDIRKGISNISFPMKANFSSNLVNQNLLGKYRFSVEDIIPKDINVLRLAEVYYILAEAYYRLPNRDLSYKYIQKIMKARKTTVFSKDDKEMLKKILLEKQKEFVGEGLRFFDLKRCRNELIKETVNGFKIKVSPNDFRWTFPIPKSEYRYNKVKQNKNW